jgi:hypothetical protein
MAELAAPSRPPPIGGARLGWACWPPALLRRPRAARAARSAPGRRRRPRRPQAAPAARAPPLLSPPAPRYCSAPPAPGRLRPAGERRAPADCISPASGALRTPAPQPPAPRSSSRLRPAARGERRETRGGRRRRRRRREEEEKEASRHGGRGVQGLGARVPRTGLGGHDFVSVRDFFDFFRQIKPWPTVRRKWVRKWAPATCASGKGSAL